MQLDLTPLLIHVVCSYPAGVLGHLHLCRDQPVRIRRPAGSGSGPAVAALYRLKRTWRYAMSKCRACRLIGWMLGAGGGGGFGATQEWIPVAAVRVRDALRLLRLVFLFKNQRKAHLNGDVGMVHLRLDLHDMHHPIGACSALSVLACERRCGRSGKGEARVRHVRMRHMSPCERCLAPLARHASFNALIWRQDCRPHLAWAACVALAPRGLRQRVLAVYLVCASGSVRSHSLLPMPPAASPFA